MNESYSNEIELKAKNGMGMLFLSIFLMLAGIAATIIGGVLLDGAMLPALGVVLLILGILYTCVCWIPFLGLKILKPQEALVLTLFGKYIGTLKGEGFFYVNPFVSAVNPTVGSRADHFDRRAGHDGARRRSGRECQCQCSEENHFAQNNDTE